MKRTPDSIIGNSAALAIALERISLLAPINRPVLVLGERGTGKELAADRLHFLSSRWDAPLLKVNCAAIAEPLLESELFGYEPGAFTGATRTHKGRFERADGGTLFLDEIGTMSTRLQEKLLRLVEYGEFERLGGQQTLQVDVRVIAATNADLPALAQDGQFRADLLDRLSFDVVHLPALRHRPEDIGELAEHFAIQMSSELGWELFTGFTASATEALYTHTWPGNIRELKNVVERSLYRWGDGSNPVGDIVLDAFKSPFEEPEKTVLVAPVTEAPAQQEVETKNFHAHIEALEKQLLSQALERHGFNQRLTAQSLGLSYDQIRGLVRKHALSRRGHKAAQP
ncbi:MAG: phage shock protein operon transcriptional activator [Halioglobus sp.]